MGANSLKSTKRAILPYGQLQISPLPGTVLARLRVEIEAPGLTIDNAAHIEGTVRYHSSTPAIVGPEASIGEVIATITPATAVDRSTSLGTA